MGILTRLGRSVLSVSWSLILPNRFLRLERSDSMNVREKYAENARGWERSRAQLRARSTPTADRLLAESDGSGLPEVLSQIDIPALLIYGGGKQFLPCIAWRTTCRAASLAPSFTSTKGPTIHRISGSGSASTRDLLAFCRLLVLGGSRTFRESSRKLWANDDSAVALFGVPG